MKAIKRNQKKVLIGVLSGYLSRNHQPLENKGFDTTPNPDHPPSSFGSRRWSGLGVVCVVVGLVVCVGRGLGSGLKGGVICLGRKILGKYPKISRLKKSNRFGLKKKCLETWVTVLTGNIGNTFFNKCFLLKEGLPET